MNKSGRIYITLNPKKHKDKIILDYLNANYSYSETIKNILFQIASENINRVNIGANLNIMNESVREQKGAHNINGIIVDESSINKVSVESIEEVDDDIKNMFV